MKVTLFVLLLLLVYWTGVSAVTVTIDVDYTPPPDFVGGPNDYRAASTVTLTCKVSTGMISGWSSTCTGSSSNCFVQTQTTETISRTVLRSTDSGSHTCTATRGGSATIEMNVVGAGIYVNTGDDSVPTGVLPNNGIVIALDVTSGDRIQFQCRSGSTMRGVGQLVDLDGNTFNIGMSVGVFIVQQTGGGSGSVQFRNRQADPDLTAADEGVYTCRIPDDTGSDVDVNIGVYRNGFNTLPTVSSLTYDTQTLTCTSTGSPATTVTWTKDGDTLTVDGTTYSMTQNVTDRRTSTYENVLTLPATGDISGNYRCQVGNALGDSQMTLTVIAPLQLPIDVDYIPPSDFVGGSNDYRAASTLTLTCQAEGATGTVTYLWTSTCSTGCFIHSGTFQNQAVGRSSLISVDSGSHTCTATDSDGGEMGSATIEINVVGAGIFVVTGDGSVPTGVLPNNGLVIARTSGTSISFQCRSGSTMTGVGQLVVLDGNTFNTGQSTGVFSVASIGNPVQPGSIQIHNRANNEPALTTADEGVYTCRIPDETGGDVDVNIGVYRNGFNTPPTVSSLTYNCSTRTLTCTSTGSPATTVTWTKDGDTLTVDGTTYSMTQTVTDRGSSTYENVLTLPVMGDISGMYGCLVENALGNSDQRTVNLRTPASLQVEITPNGGDTAAGEQYTLTCTVTVPDGLSGTLTAEWTGDNGKTGFTEGTAMTSGRVTTLTLTFDPLRDSQDGMYTCMAAFSCQDVADQTASAVQNLDVVPPEVTVTVSATGGNPTVGGTSYSLTCDHDAPLSLMATVQSTLTTPGGTMLTSLPHTFNPLRVTTGGQYSCTATVSSPYLTGDFPATQGTTLDVVVEISSPGVEASADPTGTSFAGSLLTLTCTITLDGGLSGMLNDLSVTTVWTEDGQEVSDGGNIMVSGAAFVVGTTYSSTLSFNTVHTDDARDYTCTATVSPSVPSSTVINGVGSSDPPVTVLVNVPEVTVTVSAIGGAPIVGGTSYSLTCDHDAPLSLMATVQSTLTTPGGTMLTSLPHTFNPLRVTDGGQYSCTVTVSSPYLTDDFRVTQGTPLEVVVEIPDPVVTITSDASGTLYAGSILTLTCTITLHQTLSSMLSDLSVTSTWVKSGSVLMSSTNSVISPAMLSGGTYSSTVVFNTTNTADAGNYFCRATVTPRDMSKTAFTTGGESSSQTEMIRVQIPTITVSLTPNTTRLPTEPPYNTFTITCTATAPEGVVAGKTIEWKRGIGSSTTGLTEIADNGDTIQIMTTSPNQPETISVLTVTETTPMDYRYRCIVDIPELGSGSRKTKDVYPIGVIAPVHPATAENLMVTALTSISATTTWTVPMIAFTPETYSVKYGTERDNLESFSSPVQSGTNFRAVNLPFSVTVTGLMPQTVYYYQLVTSNSIGNRTGEIQSLTPDVMIQTSGISTAGENYMLICNSNIPIGLSGDLAVGWSRVEGGISQQDATHSATLMFNPLRSSHEGDYNCSATLSSATPVTVVKQISVAVMDPDVPLRIIRSASEPTAGENYTLTCTVVPPGNLNATVEKIEWNDSTNSLLVASVHEEVSLDLSFTPLELNNTENYTCSATVSSPYLDHELQLHTTTYLNVQIPSPDVQVTHVGNTVLYAGSRLALTCTVTLPNVLSGYKVGVNTTWNGVRDGENTTVTDATLVTNLVYSSMVVFSLLHTRDTGNYTCMANIRPPLGFGSISTEESHTLAIIIEPPKITVTLEPNTTRLPTEPPYNTFTITCTATAPEGVVAGKTIEWMRRIGSSTTSLTEITDNGNTIQIETTNPNQPETISVLTVTETAPGDYRYRCRVDIPELDSNDMDEDVYPINVTAPANPEVPMNITMNTITSHSATIQWTVSQIAFTPETYVVHYGTSNGSLDLMSDPVESRDDFEEENSEFCTVLIDLLHQTMYYFNVTATNTIGSTSTTVLNFHTEEIPSGKVSNLTVSGVNDSTLEISWAEPQQPNGKILHYNISMVDLVSHQISFQNVTYMSLRIEVGNLGPGIPYSVSVAAVNSAGIGEIDSEIGFTKEEAPSAPQKVEVMRLNNTHMNVSWELLTLTQARGHVTNYSVSYQPTGSVEVETKVVPGDRNSVAIGGLDPYQAYSVQVWANTTAGGGNTSETVTIEAVLSQKETDHEDGAGAVAGGAVGAILAIVIVVACCIVAVVVARWLRQHGKLQFSDRPRSKSTTVIKQQEMAPDISSEGGIELTAIGKEDSANVDNDDYFEDTSLMMGERTRPIPVSLFGVHVERMSQDRNKGLELEYRSLGKQPQSSYDVSEIPHNKVRNRFINIFPYDFSRVKLKEIEGVDGSDYINASFLDGYRKKRAYIGAQGPLSNSLTDFVRMIWEQRLPTVVMVTRCFESARKKCEQYWPEKIDETLTPGINLSVTLTSILPYAEYEVRKFTVKDDSDPEQPPLQVTHFYYLGWPDHGVPTNAMSVINFIKQVRKVHPPSHNRPLLVHCSAGVGRTGTFIVIDSMLQRMKEEDSLNIFEFLRKLRSQRVLMVQTETQYVFIHDALNELITCGETEILAGNLRIITNQLNRHAEGKKISGFQNQYEILEQVSCKVKDGDYTEAMASYNFHKNRYTHKLACESARVVLRSTAAHGSDYINASFINGYRQCGAYIATQGPLKSTVNDFWRMMWEYQSKCIVQLCSLQEKGAEACYPYWPMVLGESVTFGKLTVTLQSESTNSDHVVRKLVVSEKKAMPVDDDSFTVTQFQYTEWAEEGEPQPTTSSLLELVKSVTKIQMGTRNKPITVICNDGMGRTGTFICIHAQLECLKTEGMVDIFQYIKSARINRAGMVQNMEQYVLCHDAVSDYVDTFETYANFKELV